MLVDVGLLLLGGVFLYFGAEWLVSSAAGIARIAGVRPLVIGLTIVSWGTSAPELVVSSVASWQGTPEIALGNVVGSNIANLGLILGVTALISPPHVDGSMIRREIPILVITAALVPLVLLNGWVSRPEGAVLVVGAVAFTLWLVRGGQSSKPAASDPGVEAAAAMVETPPKGGIPKMALLAIFALVVLVLGGRFFVIGATAVAVAVGMSERVVGLTVVAVGTSLPELATSLVAAFRKESDIAVGNVIGSNIFNILVVLGGAAVLRPIPGAVSTMMVDLVTLGLITIVGAVFMRAGRLLNRIEGGVLLAGYVGFLVVLVVGG